MRSQAAYAGNDQRFKNSSPVLARLHLGYQAQLLAPSSKKSLGTQLSEKSARADSPGTWLLDKRRLTGLQCLRPH